jgi:hypothetical protein
MRKILLAVCLLICTTLFAKTGDTGIPPKISKKNDINGAVVSNVNNKPLKEVNVTAYLSSKKEKIVLTDADGYYAFDDLKPGTYKLVFEKEGYNKVVKEKVTIKGDEGFTLDIEMTEEEDFEFLPGIFRFSDLD